MIQMPAIDGDGLDRLLGEEFPSLEKKYRGQFVQLFLDLQKKCESAEISSKALDLRVCWTLAADPPGDQRRNGAGHGYHQ